MGFIKSSLHVLNRCLQILNNFITRKCSKTSRIPFCRIKILVAQIPALRYHVILHLQIMSFSFSL